MGATTLIEKEMYSGFNGRTEGGRENAERAPKVHTGEKKGL